MLRQRDAGGQSRRSASGRRARGGDALGEADELADRCSTRAGRCATCPGRRSFPNDAACRRSSAVDRRPRMASRDARRAVSRSSAPVVVGTFTLIQTRSASCLRAARITLDGRSLRARDVIDVDPLGGERRRPRPDSPAGRGRPRAFLPRRVIAPSGTAKQGTDLVQALVDDVGRTVFDRAVHRACDASVLRCPPWPTRIGPSTIAARDSPPRYRARGSGRGPGAWRRPRSGSSVSCWDAAAARRSRSRRKRIIVSSGNADRRLEQPDPSSSHG